MILIIKIAAITMLFVVSEPMILLKRFIGFKDEDYMKYGKVKAFISRLINCCLCSGFWLGLILTGSMYDAALISIISELIYKLNNRL
jgi:hypothetical protein